MLILTVLVGLAVVGGIVALVSEIATPVHHVVNCKPTCDQPPKVVPVADHPVFIGPHRAYTVQYEATDASVKTSIGPSGVIETLRQGDGGILHLFGVNASDDSAKEVADAIVENQFPSAQLAYVVPNAVVGLYPGYGLVEDVYPQSGGGSALHYRLVVMVAVKNDLALIGEAYGPYEAFSPSGPSDGHPTGVSVVAAAMLDPLINSFSWRGDSYH